MVSAERLRVDEADRGSVPWRRWGPYLSERQWGTVREDYGSGDNTWSYFSHDQARSRAYRWGEDGLAGVSDDRQRLCLALGLWNGRDPILKEREISDRLTRTFLKDAHGRRPVHGGQPILQSDPHWRDLVLFYEYFHGDNGAGIGASHQTGWTGTAGLLPLLFRGVSAEGLRSGGRGAIKRAAAGGRAGGGGAMTGWPGQPVIYEINTAVWLDELSRAAGWPVTLAGVAAAAWDAAVPGGVDAVWLMGVWGRSPAGLALANANAELQASFAEALPDLRHADVIGSPYCVRRYVVDAGFGGPDALAVARAALAARGVRLILDYVPNHVAPDHPWVASRPELFVDLGPWQFHLLALQ